MVFLKDLGNILRGDRAVKSLVGSCRVLELYRYALKLFSYLLSLLALGIDLVLL